MADSQGTKKATTKKATTKKATTKKATTETPVMEQQEVPQEEQKIEVIDNMERDPSFANKVQAITADNYLQVVERANALKDEMKHWDNEHGTETTFASPSLNYLRARYNMSIKALSRHRKNVMASVGKSGFEIQTIKALSLPRKRKAKAPTNETPADVKEQMVALDQ